MAQSPRTSPIVFLYGPRDGMLYSDAVPYYDDRPVLTDTAIVGTNGRKLLARYLPASRSDDGSDVLVFDGWFLDKEGEAYGPKTGGTTLT